ncbi:MAG: hypothetical protein RIC19_06860 [Phaeodactylibacter sp.]|uniref:hypothetical protein n=1 Tax=Phaeodactylibacter sp. TaxID=1940289 RepID=UPI0032EBAF94
MKMYISILTLAWACLFSSQNLHAQEDEQGYAFIEYMKVKPGMMDEYLECEAVWKLIHQYRIKAGLIEGWELEQVMLPRGTGTEYDFLTVTHYKSWDDMGQEATWYDAALKTLPADKRKIAENAEIYRDIVKTEIWAAGDMAFEENGTSRPRFIVDNYMKIPAGGWEDWIEMETGLVKPVHKKNIAAGNRAGWVMAFLVLPRGDGLPYQASTMDFYHSWEDMNNDEGAAWETVYPEMSEAYAGRRIESTRTLVRTEVRMLVDFAE